MVDLIDKKDTDFIVQKKDDERLSISDSLGSNKRSREDRQNAVTS